MGSPEDEQRQIDIISFILVVMVLAVLPLVLFPKVINTPINTKYFWDIYGYYKMVFLIVLSMIMITLMGFCVFGRKQRIKFCLPLSLFLLWVLVSLFFAEDLGVAFHGFPSRWQGFVAYFCYFIIFTFIVNMLNKKYIGKILAAYFVSVCICAIQSLLNYYGIEPLNLILDPIWGIHTTPDIVRGTLGNRNTAGAFFAIPTIMSLVMFIKSNSKKKNVLFFLVFVLSYTGLLASLTRVAWLGTIGALVMAAWIFRKNYKEHLKKFVLVMLTFVVVLAFLDISGGGKIAGRYYSLKLQINKAREGNIEQFGTNRIFVYGRAIKVIAENPIVGVGPDCFAYYCTLTNEDYEEHPELEHIGYFDKVHSDYLEYAATMGIPALIFYLWFLLSIFIPWIRRGKEIKPEILAILLGLFGYLVQACFNFAAISVLPGIYVLLGILQNALVKENNEEINEQA